MKKHYTASFKSQVVQELLKEKKTIAQTAVHYELHPTQLSQWKSIVVDGMPGLFEEKNLLSALQAEYEGRLNGLFSMTMDTYSHVLPSLQEQAVTRLNRLFTTTASGQ